MMTIILRYLIMRFIQIICHLVDDGVISKDEGNLLSAATCDKALTAPQHVADVIRSNILKETIIQILKR